MSVCLFVYLFVCLSLCMSEPQKSSAEGARAQVTEHHYLQNPRETECKVQNQHQQKNRLYGRMTVQWREMQMPVISTLHWVAGKHQRGPPWLSKELHKSIRDQKQKNDCKEDVSLNERGQQETRKQGSICGLT